MNAAGDRLEPYLPSLVLDWLSETPDARHQAVAGSVVFVDISGFTKLSERLARLGKVGAELLAETIGACFSELLTVAYDEGGGLLKFGGDALLLLFDGEGHEGRACRAAIGMRRTLRRIGRLDVSGQSVSLRMSVGVHTGVFHLFLVGGSHRELVVAGPAATTVVEMESTAGAGEILVSPTTAAAIRANYVGAAKGPGFLLLRAPDTRIEPRPASNAAALGVDISACISVAVRESLVAGSVEPEHRRVTVAFVHFDGTDELIESRSAEDATREIDDMITDVQRAVDRQGIAFLGSDVDHDGGKVILTAGAPKSSGDDERRMLLALREIMERERAISLRIGVNRGDAFVGDIGPRYRRTFTVMGDAVNLAARVMARAGPGEILATESVIEGSPTAFETSALEPFLVKGKAKPVTAFAVGAPVGAKVSSTTVGSPLIGRKVEVDVMTRAMRAAIAGEGALVELVGEPGLGKSRLVEELQRRASAMTQIAAACEPYESSTPYFPFRVLLREQLGIPATLPGDEARQRLETLFAALAPEYHAWAPLVARVIDVDMPDTPEIAQLDERFRRARLGEVMRGVLAHVMSTPTLVLFEDAHWMDEASADLLGDLATTVGFLPCLICVTRRDTDSGFTPREGTATTLRLEPLGPADAAELLRVATERSPIPAHELAALAERSGGNPLFLQELVATVRDSDSMDALPDTIEALITARIDRLPPNDRMVLRRASVLGRSFPRDLLPAVFDVVPPRGDDVWTRLSGFLSNDDSGTVAFEHALVRDCAYEGLSYRVRRRLHAQVADLIRESAGDEPDTAAARLSVHYLHAQRFAEAWDYSLVAAAQAKAVYANVEAAEHYERAIQASRSLPDLGVDEMVGVHESLGDVLDRVGTFAAAQRAYRAARRLVRDDPVAEAGLLMKLAWVQGWLDRYSQALRWITRGIKTLEGVEGREAARRRAQLLAWYGHFCQEGGRHARAIKWCTLAVTEAEAVGADDALAHALRVLDWAYMDLGRLDEAVNLTRALTLYEKLGDLTGQSNVLNMLGGFAYWRGEWSDALDLYARAREIGQRTGDTVMPAFCASNIGEIALDQGRLDDARELFVEALHVWRGTGRRSGVAFAKCNLGRVAASQGDYAEAERLFEESRAESLAVGAHAEVLETDARLAECYAMAGDVERALELVEHTLEQARSLGGVRAQSPLLWRIQAMCWLRLGDLDAARPAIEQSLSDARARQADYEVALSLLLQADLVERGGVGPPAEELRAESDGILERLGAVAARGFVSV